VGYGYLGTRPSRKAIKRALGEIHEMTSRRWNWTSAEERIERINSFLRGWAGYFDQGPVTRTYNLIRKYIERRIWRWLMGKHGQRGTCGEQLNSADLEQ
jgi:RNA-directed DNA polymerase